MDLRSFGGALALLSAASVVPAQRTWIVDASNGPGADFTSLAPACAAAREGDTLLVRSGAYAGVTIGKGLRVVGLGSVSVESLTVTGVSRGQSFVAKNLDLSSFWFPRQLSVASCAGDVLM